MGFDSQSDPTTVRMSRTSNGAKASTKPNLCPMTNRFGTLERQMLHEMQTNAQQIAHRGIHKDCNLTSRWNRDDKKRETRKLRRLIL